MSTRSRIEFLSIFFSRRLRVAGRDQILGRRDGHGTVRVRRVRVPRAVRQSVRGAAGQQDYTHRSVVCLLLYYCRCDAPRVLIA